MIYYCEFQHDLIGKIYITSTNDHLLGISFFKEEFRKKYEQQIIKYETNHIIEDVKQLLQSYYSGEKVDFSGIPLLIKGTPFQQSVWECIKLIPYGTVITYGDIARNVSSPAAVRAVGQACKANPFPFIIPCHRVMGKNGKLTGYAGDLTSTKEKLLKLEGYL